MASSSDFKMNPPRQRLIGQMPKVGIRPTIDGRRKGVRESLEGQTMALARAVAELISSNLRHANGLPVECVIADTCIGGVAEAAQTAEKFARAGVGCTITVTPCWCYGSETMDMDPLIPKAVWGFNGTERPGAVYLAAVQSAHNQKGLPAFSIYGRDVQDATDTSIPEDVREKLLRFARAGLAVAEMRGKSYLALGGVSMGIAGSIVDHSLFESYLGMRVESVDMTELVRRMEEGIYDHEEFQRAMAWVKAYCREGRDYNPPEQQLSRAQKDKNWETVVKMTMIARDLMVGNPRLAEMGYGEEALGHNAIAAGFQGQRHWTDHFPNGDFMEAILCSSFDWNGIREAFIMATENDSLNAIPMLFGHLLTNTAQIFSDVRTFWSPAAVKRVTGYTLRGRAEGGIIHLINSGATALDATGRQRIGGEPAMKPFWEITPEEAQACLEASSWTKAADRPSRKYATSSGSSRRDSSAALPMASTLRRARKATVSLPCQIESRSWVTCRMVSPRRSRSSAISRSNAAAPIGSSPEVGSSSTSSSGSSASARASAARLTIPPDSSAGYLCAASAGSPDRPILSMPISVR